MRFLLVTLTALLFLETSFAQATKESNEEQEFSIDQIKSIMLDEEEMEKIKRAFDLYGKGQEFVVEEKTTEKLSDEEEEKMRIKKLSEEMKLIEEKSKIYLGSILYFSNKVWSVWINDKRITSMSNSPEDEIYIENIDGKKIDLIWTMALSKWKILMTGTSNSVAINDNPTNQIKTKVTLYPNQTYSLRTNEIVEGKQVKKITDTTEQKAN